MDLKEATENVYARFSKYHVEGNLRARSCDCCVTDKAIRQLLSKPLKKLNEDDLRWFMSKAMTTFGNVQDYKHFLPRILELMQYPNSDFIEDFIIYEKLNYSEWETWDVHEIDAIDNYFLALWVDTLKSEDILFSEWQNILEIIEKYVSLEKGLGFWEKHLTRNNILLIVDYVFNDYNSEGKLYEWFSKPIIMSKLQEVYFETENKDIADRISIVYTILENYKTR